MIHIAANLYLLIIAATILFQLCLIAGAPWGRYTQGGQHEGKLPTQNRIGAAVSIFIVLAMAAGVASAAGLWPHLPPWTAWGVLALQMLSTGMNCITPSRKERWAWGPIATVMLVLIVLFN